MIEIQGHPAIPIVSQTFGEHRDLPRCLIQAEGLPTFRTAARQRKQAAGNFLAAKYLVTNNPSCPGQTEKLVFTSKSPCFGPESEAFIGAGARSEFAVTAQLNLILVFTGRTATHVFL